MFPILISLATLGVATFAARMSYHNHWAINAVLIEIKHTRKEVKLMAEITAELFDGLLAKLEELADADPEDKATIERLQREVGELTLQAASQDAKYGWINDNERQARVARLAEKVGLSKTPAPTGPEAPLPTGPVPETPAESEPTVPTDEIVDEGIPDEPVVTENEDAVSAQDNGELTDENDRA